MQGKLTSYFSGAKRQRVEEEKEDKEEMPPKIVADEQDDDYESDGEPTPHHHSTSSHSSSQTLAKLVRSTNFNPTDSPFKEGERVPFVCLAKCFEKISQTSSRLQVIILLCNTFRSIISLTPEDLLPAVYLAANKIAPPHKGLELGVGDALLIKSIAECAGKTEKFVKEQYHKDGDLGVVAQQSRATQQTLRKPMPLTVRGVFQTLQTIALASGKEAGKRRVEYIKQLLVAATDTEPVFIVRALQGKLRIGLAEQTVLSALALAFVLSAPRQPQRELPPTLEGLQICINDATEKIRTMHAEVPSFDIIVPKVLEHGIIGAAADPGCQITNGLPVRPMLAKPTTGIKEVLDRFTGAEFTCEFKYDGERAQIHYAHEKVAIYSRNSENNTSKYPDIIQMLPTAIGSVVQSFILDSEVVAFDPKENKILPFQQLQRRGRKNIQLDEVKVPVCVFAFDLLYFNGESLLRETLAKRREILHANFHVVPNVFQFARALDSSDPEDIQGFLMESIQNGCEGLMVKSLKVDATYQPAKRSFNWLKVKKDYLKGMGDSFDLVPIGAYIGKGKRTGVFGGFLLACYDDESEEFQSICKIGTGFSEEALEQFTSELTEKTIDQPKPYYRFADDHRPDVWFEEAVVWEILAADLSISPAHLAALGKVDSEKGIALRFPRFIRTRPDKSPTDATTATQVAEMFQRQFDGKQTGGYDGGAER
eukprot:TRINITY_DN636_c0_g1_i1.p1 TRINITY_DN636_c0_g1~~TRINITY_DN636_c0_g1_i1.p1  ORF type:complete len:708 (+),score=105.73 TRINITY_DN636_c0_g1_i1:1073-3196(+)